MWHQTMTMPPWTGKESWGYDGSGLKSWGENMKAGMCGVAVLMGALGIVVDVAAVPENNSSLAPLIL